MEASLAIFPISRAKETLDSIDFMQTIPYTREELVHFIHRNIDTGYTVYEMLQDLEEYTLNKLVKFIKDNGYILITVV